MEAYIQKILSVKFRSMTHPFYSHPADTNFGMGPSEPQGSLEDVEYLDSHVASYMEE